MPIFFLKTGEEKIIKSSKLYRIIDVKKIMESYIKDMNSLGFYIEPSTNFVIFVDDSCEKTDENLNQGLLKKFNCKVYGDAMLFFSNELDISSFIEAIVFLERQRVISEMNRLNKLNDVNKGYMELLKDIEEMREKESVDSVVYTDIELFLKYVKSTYQLIDESFLIEDLIEFIKVNKNEIISNEESNSSDGVLYCVYDGDVCLDLNKSNVISVVDYIIDFYASKEKYKICSLILKEVKEPILKNI